MEGMSEFLHCLIQRRPLEYKPYRYRPLPKLRATPLEKAALNFSIYKIQSFWPNMKKTLYRGYTKFNETRGPYNSTFYGLNISFYNRFRIVKYSTGVVILPNYTAQMLFIRGPYRTPSKKAYVPLNETSEEAQKAINFVTYRINRYAWFTMPSTLVNTTNIEVSRATGRRKLDYYRMAFLYTTPIMNVTLMATINKNITSGYFRFNYIGMKTIKPPKKIKIESYFFTKKYA